MLGVEIHPDNRVGSSLPTLTITNKNNNKCHIANHAEITTAQINSINHRNANTALTRLAFPIDAEDEIEVQHIVNPNGKVLPRFLDE